MKLSWIRKLVARSPRTVTTRRSRPGVESLEQRSLLSASPSLTIPALSNMKISLGHNQASLDSHGHVTSADVHVSKVSFAKAGVTFTARNLEVKYTAAGHEYDVSGSASATIAGKTFNVTFGDAKDPGIVVRGKSLTRLTATLQAPDLSFGGAELKAPQLTVGYVAATGTSPEAISLSGSADLTLRSHQDFSVRLGDSSGPGLLIQKGHVTAVSAAVAGNFHLGSLSVKSDGVRVTYAAAANGTPKTFTVSGDAEFQVKGSTVKIDVSSAVIQKGSLQSLTASVNSDLHLLGLTLACKDLTVAYRAAQDEVGIYGEVALTAGTGDTLKGIDATLGSASDAGLQIVHGTLTRLDVTLNGGFRLAGLGLTPQDLEVAYSKDTGVVQIQGGVEIALGKALDVTTTLTDGGLTIDTTTGAVQVHGLDVKCHLPLGGFELDADLKFAQNAGAISVAFDGTVTFPSGFAVEAGFDVESGQLHSLQFNYDAGSTGGLPVGDTGLFVTHVGGAISNLDDVKHLDVAVTLGVTYGKSVTVLGHTYSLFSATGKLTVNPDELCLDADVALGGGILGSGHGTVDINWAKGQTTIDAHVSIYDDIFDIQAHATLDKNGLQFGGDGAVHLPKDLPVIGNDTIGTAHVALNYDPSGKTANTITATGSLRGVGDVTFTEDFGENATYDLADGAVKQVYQVLKSGFETLHQTFDKGVQTLNDAWDTAGGEVKETWDQAGNYTRETWSSLGIHTRTVLGTTGMTIKETWDRAGDHIKEVLAGGADCIEMWDAAGGYKVWDWDGKGGCVQETLEGGKETVKTFSNGVETMEQDFTDSVKTLEKDFTDGVETMEQDFTHGVKTLEKDFSKGMETVEKHFTNGVKTLEKDFNATGGYVQTTYVNGVAQASQTFNEAGEVVTQQVTPVVEEVWDDVSSIF